MSSCFIGCPVWSSPHWRGSVYAAKAPKEKWLHQYSQTFNTVEGNSTFYGIPKLETFERWAQQAEDGFRFALKFPGAVSHEKQLQDVDLETEQFLNGLEVLQDYDRLGPAFLQLGPAFDARKFSVLQQFLASLPMQFSYAIELRNKTWFEEPMENELNHCLAEHNIDRVILDSRPLFSAPPDDELEAESQRRKPRSPVRLAVTGQHPMVRLIGRNDISLTKPWVRQWVPTIANWIDNGLQPFVFLHSPDDRFAPEFARLFQNELASRVKSVAAIDQWRHAVPVQQELF